MDNPNAWTTPELIRIGLIAFIYLGTLAFALYQVIISHSDRLTWIAVSLCMLAFPASLIVQQPATFDLLISLAAVIGTWIIAGGKFASWLMKRNQRR